MFMPKRAFLILAVAVLAACDTWTGYVSQAGGYTVKMPVDPDLRTERRNTPLGQADFIEARAEDGAVRFTAAFADLPGDKLRRAKTKAVLQGMQNLEADQRKAKIVDVSWDEDLEGLRFLFLTEDGRAAHVYYLLRGTRFYILSVEGAVAEVKDRRSQMFFTSFKQQ